MKYKYNYTNNAKKFESKNVIFVILLIIIVIAFSLFLFRENSIVKNINNVLLAPINFISNSLKDSKIDELFKTKNDLKEENESLKNENNELKIKMLEFEKLLKENDSLRSQLKIKSKYTHYNLAVGSIILRAHESYNSTFVINIGTKDGVKENDAVIHEEGLVGYISNVSDSTSTVVTLLDPKTSVSVVLPISNAPAILGGSMELKEKQNLKLDSIQIGSNISVNDTVYTSGLGNLYPALIPVAKVISVKSKKGELIDEVICTPLVDIMKINEVAVIIGDEKNE